MKKLVSVILALVVVLALAGSASAAIKLNLSEVHIEGYPTTLADQKFAELVKERTEGRIEIDVYFGGTLFPDEPTSIEALVMGELAFSRVSASPVTEFVPTINAIMLPYLYKSGAHMWAVLNGEIGQKILSGIQESGSGLIGLCYYDAGSRNFYLTKAARTPADLAGLKIRVQDSQLMTTMIKLLGATPVVGIGSNEIYGNIVSGVLDGAENNWPTYYTKGDYKAATFFVLDGHTRVPEILLASEAALKNAGVTPEDMEIIRQCAKDTQEFEIEQWKQMDANAEAAVREAGNTIIELTGEELALFQAAMAPIYTDPNFGGNYKEIIDAIALVGADF